MLIPAAPEPTRVSGDRGDEVWATPALPREPGHVDLGVDLPVTVAMGSPQLPGDAAAAAASSRHGRRRGWEVKVSAGMV